MQLQVNVTYSFDEGQFYGIHETGVSTLFALTDTATAATLSYLYHIPSGLKTRYGSNQSVAEFYGEVRSFLIRSTFLTCTLL